MKPLPSYEELHRLFRYDPETGHLYRRVNVPTRPAGSRADRVCPKGYCKVKAHGHLYFAHRVIWKMQTGDDPRAYIDHKNRVQSDNRWGNLREATTSENNQNGFRPKASGLPRGVTHFGSRYEARIRLAGQRQRLGSFDTPEEAAAAYRRAASILHGSFAFHLNGAAQ
jgi:hypothetical protein